jgi:hypoxanthine phosphoribosyltransferase
LKDEASGMRCRLVELDEVYELSFELARRVQRARFEPEIIVAIARGGFVPARLLCDFLGVHALASQRIRHYGAGARRQERARIEHPLAAEVGGRRVLVVDDVNDTGETLALARAHLASLGPSDVRVAVLHEKTSSRELADFRARSIEQWHWLLYQWAIVEDSLGFVSRMSPLPATPDEARERLDAEFGLSLPDAHWQKVRVLLEPGRGPRPRSRGAC